MNKVCIITDAWLPQINGVVRSIQYTVEHLINKGYNVTIVHPELFKTFSCPGYNEIKLSIFPDVSNYLDEANFIHIATEGPLGFSARGYCIRKRYKFNTAYHTRFPEYIKEYYKIPTWLTYPLFRWFHKKADNVSVSTESLKSELTQKGFKNVSIWKKGVDTNKFQPVYNRNYYEYKRPIYLNVGRVSTEKNIEVFLQTNLPGTKVIIGDGPALKDLKSKYPDVVFTGPKSGDDLVKAYSSADIFVFPSLTDTLGLVNLEALACGLPVVAFEQDSLKEIVVNGYTGYLAKSNEDLQTCCLSALNIDKNDCRSFAEENDWAQATNQFIKNLVNK